MWEQVENPITRPIEDDSEKAVACCCNCQEMLYSNEEFLEFEGEYVCDDLCLKQYFGVRSIYGGELL